MAKYQSSYLKDAQPSQSKYQSSYLKDAQPVIDQTTTAKNSGSGASGTTTPATQRTQYIGESRAYVNDPYGEAMRSYVASQQAAQNLADTKASYQNQLGSMNGEPASMNLNYGTVSKSASPTDNSGSYGGNGGSVGVGGSEGNYPGYDTSYEDYLREAAEARQRELEAQYQRALGQLQSAYDRGKGALATNSDEAKRQAYINYMNGRRNLNQELSMNGINGGATESILANLYNEYGNNRAAIDKQYADALNQLGVQYEQGVANLGDNYGGNYADVLTDYYNGMAAYKQKYASDLAKMIGKNSASNATTASANNGYSASEIVTALNSVGANRNGLKNALALYGIDIDSSEGQRLLLQSGIDPLALGTDEAINNYGATNGSSVLSIPQATADAIKNRLKQVYNTSDYDEATRSAGVAQAMRQLALQYNLTDEEARRLLAEAGF